jgi:hypothetical protein
MINEREKLLTFLLTYSLFSGGNDLDFNLPFFTVLGYLLLDVILTLILTFVFYNLITKHVYKWIVKNS